MGVELSLVSAPHDYDWRWPLSSFQIKSTSASSFYASLLQAIDGVMSLAFVPAPGGRWRDVLGFAALSRRSVTWCPWRDVLGVMSSAFCPIQAVGGVISLALWPLQAVGGVISLALCPLQAVGGVISLAWCPWLDVLGFVPTPSSLSPDPRYFRFSETPQATSVPDQWLAFPAASLSVRSFPSLPHSSRTAVNPQESSWMAAVAVTLTYGRPGCE